MRYQDLIARTIRENILFTALLEITYRCDLQCVYCFNDRERTDSPLTTDEWLGLLDDLNELQVLHLVFSGGEPLAHRDFLRIGSRARELGFVIRIKSNGHALQSGVARRVQEQIDPFIIDLSIHGAHAETHDRQTCVAGSFRRLMDNIEAMLGLGMRLKLNCTVTRWNQDEVEDIVALSETLGLPISVNPIVSPRDDGDSAPQELAASAGGLRRTFQLLDSRAAARAGRRPAPAAAFADDEPPKPAGKYCGAGSTTVAIDPFGNVLPCVQWRQPVGNVRDRRLVDIWNGSRALHSVRSTLTEAQALADELAPGRRLYCPARSLLSCGDPLRIDTETERALQTAPEVEVRSKVD